MTSRADDPTQRHGSETAAPYAEPWECCQSGCRVCILDHPELIPSDTRDPGETIEAEIDQEQLLARLEAFERAQEIVASLCSQQSKPDQNNEGGH